MKKLLTMMLVLAMLCSLSLIAFADTTGSQTLTVTIPEDQKITSASVTIRLPSAGANPASGASTADSEKYTAKITSFEDEDGNPLYASTSYTYEAGKTYTLTIQIDRVNPYKFDNTAGGLDTLTVNNTLSANKTDLDEETGTYTFTYTVPVEPSSIADASVIMTLPAADAHPSFTGTVPDGALYDVESIVIKDGDAVLTASDTYEDGKTYTIIVKIKVKDGEEGNYTLTNDTTLTVNGRPTSRYTALGEYILYYTVETQASPEWTLNIPASVTISTFEPDGTPIFNGITFITCDAYNQDLLGHDRQISYYMKHTGALTSGANTIPFTMINDGNKEPLPADQQVKLGYFAYSEMSGGSIPSGYYLGVTVSEALLKITENDWYSASPGTYTTTVTYSSALENK